MGTRNALIRKIPALALLLVCSGWALAEITTAQETSLRGVATRIGYFTPLERVFSKGQLLNPVLDDSMPYGYERVYVKASGAIVGFLPESGLSIMVRQALIEGQKVHIQVVEVQAESPVDGVRVAVSVM